jgi:thioredoxin reductase
MHYDVVIAGGGPAGLAAALTLGRARKRVLLCDGGPRRNAAAIHVHNFVTRDGIAPREFRRIAREQLAVYPSVEVRDTKVQSIAGERGAFEVALDDKGFVRIDATTQETSRPGIYAAGDLTTGAQGAILAAAAGTRAAAMLNHALTLELARSGALA